MRRCVLLVASVLVACGDNRNGTPDAEVVDASASLAFVSGPTITLPSADAPLTGLLEVSINRPARVSIAITDDTRAFTIERHAVATDHAIPVLGLRSGTTHTITVTATDSEGMIATAAPITVTTALLPASFPAFTTNRVVPAQIEPGVTFFGMSHYVIAVDDEGKVIWFVNLPGGIEDVRMLGGGTIILEFSDHVTAEEIDVFGRVLRHWSAANTINDASSIAVAVDSFHHELNVMTDGNFLALATERRTYNGYPTSETDPTPQTSPQAVVGDQVVVFAPDGTIVHRFSMLDRADPYRLGYGSFGNFWSPFYAPPAGSIDWSHGNAVFPDPSDGGYLVSLRHQDALFKLDAAGTLQWILGTPDNWSSAYGPYLLAPVGSPFLWPFHQHAPRILSNGHVLVFDNGNFRVSPPAPKPATSYSRAVEYEVDPVQKQVRQVWEYDAGKTIFAPATGDVDVGPVTGNVIITFGGASRIVEVTHDAAPAVVFEMQASQTFYRSERMGSLYPAD
ncbi:MAG TPA: aryl-sulfate sulfotransferase [Kofleriaceae bacterium]|nr:aryl-sulfate sulfotransferase [Kofleriaceae bacterium]